MPTFIPARGRTLHVGGVCINRKFEAPANQPCSNVSRTSRPTRSSPVRSRPRRPSASSTRRARPCSSTRPTTSSTRTAAPTCSPSSTAATGGGRPTSSGLSRRLTEAGRPSSSTPSRALLSRGWKFSLRPCRTVVSGCRCTRRPGKRSRSTWPTATAPSSSSAGASSPAGPRTCTELPGATLPPELFNRTGDNWRGLFSIAEAAGGEWPERARAGGDGGDQRGGQQSHPAAAGSHLADLRREEGRAHAHEGPAGRPEENRGGAMGGGEQRPRDQCATGCGKSSRGSCRGPQIPKRRRRSAAPVNGGRGKAPPSKGYTEDHLREAWRRYLDRETPSETRQSGRACGGPPRRGPPDAAADAICAAAGRETGCNGHRYGKEEGAHNGHGPARALDRPGGEPTPSGEADRHEPGVPDRSALRTSRCGRPTPPTRRRRPPSSPRSSLMRATASSPSTLRPPRCRASGRGLRIYRAG